MASLIPPTYPLEFYQGDSVAFSIRARGRTSTGGPGAYYDLTGSTAKAQLRTFEEDSTSIEFTVTLGNQTTERGKINLALSHAQTAALTDTEYVWDIQITWPDGRVTTLLRGPVTVTKEVTR